MTIDLTGRKIGRMTVLGPTEYRNAGSIIWEVSCRCGRVGLVCARDLVIPKRKGCGKCADASHPLHGIWRGIISRCTEPANSSYKDYGGRGIIICTEWKEEFLQFVEDMGPRPEGYSVERKDNEKGYSKDNCKWATAAEQANNQRKNSVALTDQELVDIYYADRSLPAKYIADAYRVTPKTVLNIRCKQYKQKQMEIALSKLTPQTVKLKL